MYHGLKLNAPSTKKIRDDHNCDWGGTKMAVVVGSKRNLNKNVNVCALKVSFTIKGHSRMSLAPTGRGQVGWLDLDT